MNSILILPIQILEYQPTTNINFRDKKHFLEIGGFENIAT
ncbi:MAG: hypothetical protein ACI94Y_002689 [Maribacter sp.]|jgi:hypothetical protein